jgi:hypothetical protein
LSYEFIKAASALRCPQQVTAFKFVDYPFEASESFLNQYKVDMTRNKPREEQCERQVTQSITPRSTWF